MRPPTCLNCGCLQSNQQLRKQIDHTKRAIADRTKEYIRTVKNIDEVNYITTTGPMLYLLLDRAGKQPSTVNETSLRTTITMGTNTNKVHKVANF